MIHVIHFIQPLSLGLLSDTEVKSQDCQNAGEVILKNMDEIVWYLTKNTGVILGMGSASERWRHIVTSSLTG